MQQRCLGRPGAARTCRRLAPASRTRVQPITVPCAAGNGSSATAAPKYPSPAETARTILDLTTEGVLSSVSSSGAPLGVPVTFTVSKTGEVKLQLDAQTLQLCNVQSNPTCSLTVQPTTMPARAVAAVTLVGQLQGTNEAEQSFAVDKCLYFGGLDKAPRGHEISGAELQAAEPDVLRKFAVDLISVWNSERAEDVYRIVGHHLGISLVDMHYAELLWLDHLGMYVRCEAAGRATEVVRIPFYRPVLDERDARSVITMAAQLSWETERSYTPQIPTIFADAANAANN